MGDELVNIFIASADDSSSSVDDREEDLEAAASAFRNHSFLNVRGERHAGPIEVVMVADAQDSTEVRIPDTRYNGKKPIFVRANINTSHLNTGESTQRCSKLREVIRNRGKTEGRFKDDCGHVVSRKLGGHMVDYNLFPQSPPLNCGWMGNYVLWKGIEIAAATWLSVLPIVFQPRVEFMMLLQYQDVKFTDRPNKFKYVVKFFCTRRRRRNNDDDKEEQKFEFCNSVVNLAKAAIKNAKQNYNLRQQIMNIIKTELQNDKDVQEILEMVKDFEETMKKFFPPPSPKNPTPSPSPSRPSRSWSPPRRTTIHRNRDVSVLDFVPVVGSVKGICEGVQDLSDGNVLKGVANMALGGVSLGFDIVTFGAASSLLNGGAKAVGKVVLQKTAEKAVESATRSAAATAARKYVVDRH